MWLERVDIKDVKICSGKLFQDIQAEFRLGQSKDAEIKAISAKNTLEKEKLKRNLDTVKRSMVGNQQKARNDIRLETARITRDKDSYATDVKLQKKAKDRNNEKAIFDMRQQNDKDLQSMEL